MKTEPKLDNMICELHRENAKLCESHIIPKFVYKWMKETGSGRLRQVKTKNKPMLDGIKKHMLCKSCEDKFSKYEKLFSEKIFLPYLADNNITIENSIDLKYFIISVLWRILRLFKDDGTVYNFKNSLDEAEIEWRNFLLHDKPIKKYVNQHFILIDNSYWITQQSDVYFSRSVDIEIGQSEECCFVYAKFSRFMLIGEIVGFTSEDFENTNINMETEFCNSNQIMHGFSDYFNSRMDNMISYKDLSETQQKKNDEYYKDKLDNLQETDYLKIIKKHR